jgi:hypothetical protein
MPPEKSAFMPKGKKLENYELMAVALQLPFF